MSFKLNNAGLFLMVIVLVLFTTIQAFTQDEETTVEDKLKRFEIGGHYTYLRRANAHAPFEVFVNYGFASAQSNRGKVNESGVGVRFTYNLSSNLAFEVEGNLFPEDKTLRPIIGVPISVVEPGGRKLQAVAGPKIGIRKNKFGVFGKIRPGIIRLDRYTAVALVGPPGNFFVLGDVRRKVGFFNLDVGGVFEYYPTKRTVFRIDVGDTIVHYRKLPPKEINPSIWRNSLQTNVGFGFRF